MSIPSFVCCPDCQAFLTHEHSFLQCEHCSQKYPIFASTQIDLRPKRHITRMACFTIDPVDPLWSQVDKSSSLSLRDVSVNTLDQIIPLSVGTESVALEVGCGARRNVRDAIERAGYVWVGVDWNAESATYLADIHALPFRDGSFPLIASDAVLEHVRYPHIAIKEMARVLRPGGVMVGEVAFLQPYHTSYFHMTHEAILDLVRHAGLEPTLYANGSTSSFFYLAKRALSKWAWMVWPADRIFRTLASRRRLTGQDQNYDIYFACTVLFSARKPTIA